MKKFSSKLLCVMLTLAMLLTSVSFAAPAPVGVENAIETAQNADAVQEAVLEAETESRYEGIVSSNVATGFAYQPIHTGNNATAVAKTLKHAVNSNYTLDTDKCSWDAPAGVVETVVFSATAAGAINIQPHADGYPGDVVLHLVYTDGFEEDVTVKLVGDMQWKPGHNIFTGDVQGVSYDKILPGHISQILNISSAHHQNTAPDPTDATKNNLRIQSSTNSIRVRLPMRTPLKSAIASDRPIDVKFDYITNGTGINFVAGGAYNSINIAANDASGAKILYTMQGEALDTTTAWHSASFTYDGSSRNADSVYDMTRFGFELVRSATTATTEYLYLDNYAIIPHYKYTYHLTYHDNTTETVVAYGLPEDGVFVPNPEIVRKATTYKVGEDGAETPIEQGYTLENKDIDVYVNIPVEVVERYAGIVSGSTATGYAYQPIHTGDNAASVATSLKHAIDAAYTLDVDKCSWEAPEGVVDTVVFSATAASAINIKPHSDGYPGDVVLHLVYTDGAIEDVTVKLVGDMRWKPGNNIFTGDKQGVAYEKILSGHISQLFKVSSAHHQNSAIDPTNSAKNTLMIKSGTSATNVSLPMRTPLKNAIASDRPIEVKFDYITTGVGINFNANCDITSVTKTNTANGVVLHQISGEELNTETAWHSASFTYDGSSRTTSGEDEGSVYDITRFGFELIRSTATASSEYLCIDNYAIIPHYKYTYHITYGDDTTENIVVAYGLPEDGVFVPDEEIVGNATQYKIGADGELTDIAVGYTLKNADIDVYVNKSLDAYKPQYEAEQIRTDVDLNSDPNGMGLRVIAKVGMALWLEKDVEVTELGFIVTRKTILDNAGKSNSDFTLDCGLTNGSDFVTGVSYKVNNGEVEVDKRWDSVDPDNFQFTGVLVGIPVQYYGDAVVFRAYTKVVCDGKEYVIYGDAKEAVVSGILENICNNFDLPSQNDANYEEAIARYNKLEALYNAWYDQQ